ncbi:MAG: glycosyltransferase [Actinobacteria bacterium]|nr:glycosyltransferase [Actinomycetota bacterium]
MLLSSVEPADAARHDGREAAGRRRAIQATASLALVVTIAYLTWRILATVNLAVWWVSIPLLLLELHAASGLALHTFSLWRIDALRPVEPVEAASSRVAVLITTYNEPEEVLLPTIAAAVALEPEHATWVLDDGARPWVANLARRLGARYLARHDNADAKAGNINHALQHIDADLVAVLDADHAAYPNLLRHTLGYFDDPDMALVQTPQSFYNEGSFEDVDLRQRWRRSSERRSYHEQELFYRAIQPGKNRWSAAFWCGTGAVLRVDALRDIGGVATGSVTEDIQTTIRLHRRGWRSAYHNEVLAEGLAAATAEQYMLQRHRWCTGAMQVLRQERPLTGAGLTVTQRLAYATTLLGWFDAWRTLGFLLLPILVLLTGASPIAADLRTFAVAFGVTFGLQQVALYLLGRGRSPPLIATVFELVRMTPTLYATMMLLRASAVAFRVTPKGRLDPDRLRGSAPWLLIALLVASLGSAAWYAATLTGLTPITYDPPAVAHAAAFWLAGNTVLLSVAIVRTMAQRFARERRASYRFTFDLPALLNGRGCRLRDVSLTGAHIEMDEDLAPSGARTATHTLRFNAAVADQRCIVRSRERLDGGRMRLGVEFVDDDPVGRAELALWAFRQRPHGPRDSYGRQVRPGGLRAA